MWSRLGGECAAEYAVQLLEERSHLLRGRPAGRRRASPALAVCCGGVGWMLRLGGRYPSGCRCVLVLLALLTGTCGWPSVASAGGLRRLAPSVVGFWTDGTRYAIWQTQTGSAVSVYDTLTRHRGTLTLPAECFVADPAAGAGAFLLDCTSDQRLLDARTGAVTPLPIGPYDASWTGVGARYVEGSADKTACLESPSEVSRRRPCIALYDRATGSVSYRPQSQVGELDQPGAPVVCPRLRAAVIDGLEEKGEASYSEGRLVELIHVGEKTPTRIRITPCHGRPTVVRTLTGRNFPEDVDPAGGVMTWDSGQPGTDRFEAEEAGEDVKHGVLWSYDLSTRRREKWTLPRTTFAGTYGPEVGPEVGVFGYSDHTTHAVFWLATRTLTCDELCIVASWSVYVAPQ